MDYGDHLLLALLLSKDRQCLLCGETQLISLLTLLLLLQKQWNQSKENNHTGTLYISWSSLPSTSNASFKLNILPSMSVQVWEVQYYVKINRPPRESGKQFCSSYPKQCQEVALSNVSGLLWAMELDASRSLANRRKCQIWEMFKCAALLFLGTVFLVQNLGLTEGTCGPLGINGKTHTVSSAHTHVLPPQKWVHEHRWGNCLHFEC